MAEGAYHQELHISWEDFHRDTRELAEKLKDREWKGMLAITRGGLGPATVLSRELDITHVDTVCIASYDHQDQGELQLLKSISLEDGGDGWLVVDDLVDTGKTIKLVKELLPQAHVATVYAKPAGVDMADSYLKTVEQSCWVFFPWEE
ncbi:xanthine phosphoribosyltransferase [Sansalvadorimonas verongulae]|uniref:xanthine phosphoribosyltransferase n=1 Tax=Sansalvadorimonas verongulae TaxID=2172824 RepID=UPI0012BC8E02|nr:xanthine phosphoribosyltransferase [Sansalvadorimonas verongulae]MTI12976.1 xanthine phosphoribosyltransferase [Sansalvadorimonas verongulae]